uniref:Uncharacterized protein n=1 Tax=Cacopsylla melanoneura TaxID=428564 RepID=A0A8D8V878_9HEMI
MWVFISLNASKISCMGPLLTSFTTCPCWYPFLIWAHDNKLIFSPILLPTFLYKKASIPYGLSCYSQKKAFKKRSQHRAVGLVGNMMHHERGLRTSICASCAPCFRSLCNVSLRGVEMELRVSGSPSPPPHPTFMDMLLSLTLFLSCSSFVPTLVMVNSCEK